MSDSQREIAFFVFQVFAAVVIGAALIGVATMLVLMFVTR